MAEQDPEYVPLSAEARAKLEAGLKSAREHAPLPSPEDFSKYAEDD